jgi:hypothetical protein
MIWLTWRQFRIQFLVIAATGPSLLDNYHRLTHDFIQSLGFERLDPPLYTIGQVLLCAVPPKLGAFWGATKATDST